MVSGPPIMPGWDHYPIRDHLYELYHLPVSLNNDAEMGAVGEWAYGAGRGERNLAYIKVGTGIGAGLLLEGQIYRGATAPITRVKSRLPIVRPQIVRQALLIVWTGW